MEKKAVGVEGMSTEFWKNFGEEGTSELVDICKRIYEGIWPAKSTEAVIIRLTKRVNTAGCGGCITISLPMHA